MTLSSASPKPDVEMAGNIGFGNSLRLVVPRYGADISGGSESLMRRLALALRRRGWAIEVFTTTAGDEATWSPAFAPGRSCEDGIIVHRFPVIVPRQPWAFRQLSRAVFRVPGALRPESVWLHAQGPVAPALVRALANRRSWPTLFTPYLYPPIIYGIPAAPHPRLLIPAAHDEPALRLRAVGRAISACDGLWCGTQEELDLVKSLHPVAASRPSTNRRVVLPCVIRFSRLKRSR